MNPLSDFHIHTGFCDGNDSPQTMVLSAIGRGFHSLGFSGHSPLPFANNWAIRDEASYRREIMRLKREYKYDISISLGLEWDADSKIPRGYDYLISSVHSLSCGETRLEIDEQPAILRRLCESFFAGSREAMVRAYFRKTVEAVKRCLPDVVGHFDLIRKFEESDAPCGINEPYFIEAAEEALSEILPICPRFEVNTGAMARGYLHSPYPHDLILQKLLSLGGRVILSSDAHCAPGIGFAFEETAAHLKALGFTSVDVLRGGRFESMAL